MEPGWRVDNLGMTAFGPDLMLRALEVVGLSARPDVVVFTLLSHDLYRVMPEATGVGFPLPRYRLEFGRLVTVPYPARPPWKRLFLVQGMRYLYWRYTSASFALNGAILDRLLELAGRHRFVPSIVFLPAAHEGWDDPRRRRWLREYAEHHATPFLDLTEALRNAGIARLYIRADAHWNPEGHRVVAEALRPFLKRLIPSLATADGG